MNNSMLIDGAPVPINKSVLNTVSGEKLTSTIFHKIEASSIRKNDTYIELPEYIDEANQFMLMLQIAFSKHKGIVITPDLLWLLICQGVAEHIKLYENDFESLIINYTGKQTIQVSRDDFILGGEYIKENTLKTIKTDNEEHRALQIVKSIIKNPALNNLPELQLTLDHFPKGLSQVPFKWSYLDQELNMKFISGCIGIKEDTTDHMLSTDINWVIAKQ